MAICAVCKQQVQFREEPAFGRLEVFNRSLLTYYKTLKFRYRKQILKSQKVQKGAEKTVRGIEKGQRSLKYN